jgi:hypothetical protein
LAGLAGRRRTEPGAGAELTGPNAADLTHKSGMIQRHRTINHGYHDLPRATRPTYQRAQPNEVEVTQKRLRDLDSVIPSDLEVD